MSDSAPLTAAVAQRASMYWRTLTGLLVILSIGIAMLVASGSAAGSGVGQAAHPNASPVAIQKTCGRGYVHAIIGGAHKCLRAGQFCGARFERQYRRYGFTCRSGHLRRR